jgi:hypothetical protein
MSELKQILDALGPTYFPAEIPSDSDRQLKAALQSLGDERALRNEIPDLSVINAQFLGAFAERAASWAVRERSAELLDTGLTAAVLGHGVQGGHEILMFLPLLWRSAELMGCDPSSVFAEARRRVGADSGLVLEAFSARSPEDKSIGEMGFIEGEFDGGFVFRRTW